MNLLDDDKWVDASMGPDETDIDIDDFLNDVKPKSYLNNNINITKVDTKKSNAPVQISKVTSAKSIPKSDFLNIKECANKNTISKSHSLKSNCEFSDSDIDFADFMFSDDEFKDAKNNKNNTIQKSPINNNITSNKVLAEPKKEEKTVNTIITNNKPPEKINNTQTNKNNLDEICLADDNDDFDNGAFEISDISTPDINEPKPADKEKKIENTDQVSEKKETKIENSSQEKIKKEEIKIENTNQVCDKKERKIENQEKIKKEEKKKEEKKKDPLLALFDDLEKKQNESVEIEIPKVQPKKAAKKRKNPTRRQETKSPLNILDDLDLGISIEEDKNQVDDILINSPSPKKTKKADLKNNKLNKINMEIKVEKQEKNQNALLQPTNLPPLQTRTIPLQNEIILKSGLEAFEYSFINNLSYFLSEFRYSFITQFQNQMRKCFEFDSQINTFLINFTRELNEVFSSMSYYQNIGSLSFTNIESDIDSEFKQYLSLSPNPSTNKKENDQFSLEIEDSIESIEKVESLHSKFSNDCQNLLRQLSKESLSLNNSYQDLSNLRTISKLNDVSELESKIIQIDIERESIESRLNYIKAKSLESQEEYDFLAKYDNDPRSNRNEFNELLQNLKDFQKKGSFNSNHKFKSIIDEICDLSSQITFHSNSLSNKLFQSNKPLNPNNGYFMGNNYNNNMSSATIGYSFDCSSYTSSNEIVEEVRSRLNRVKKMREETIADLRRFEPNYNFPLAGF